MSAPKRRAVVLAGVALGLLALALLWGRLEPDTAPAWLVELSRSVSSAGVGVRPGRSPLHVAVVVDDPGAGGAGHSVVDGARLFVEQLNSRGGVDRRRIELEVYDDQGDPETAQRIARRIVEESEAVAVLGHRTSPTSLVAGPIYRDAEIPAITPTATHPDVTRDNPWFFRAIYSDDQLGRVLAHYVDVVLDPVRTIVVSGTHAYGAKLGQVFLRTAAQLDMRFTGVEIDDEGPPAERRRTIDAILDLLRDVDGRAAIVLATYPEESIELIRAIRDARLDEVTIVTPDTFDDPAFLAAFERSPNARRGPDFYTDGIVVATPLIYDTAGRESSVFRQAYIRRFGSHPDGPAAYGYDAMRAIVEALARSGAGQEATVTAMRRAIRDQLAAMDEIDAGFEGITGPIFFDPKTRTLPRAATIGRYRGGQLVSELTQFRPLPSPARGQSARRLIDEGRVIDIGGQLMKRTEVVYTGITVVDIGGIDVTGMTFDLVAHIWFRSSDADFDPADFVVLNAVGPVTTTQLNSETTTDGLVYRRLQIAGTFRLDPVPELRQYGRPLLGVAFRHRDLPAHDLIYVADLPGMGYRPGIPFEQVSQRLATFVEALGWRIALPPFVYQDTDWAQTEGAPAYLDSTDLRVPYSLFVAAARLVPVGSILGDAVPPSLDVRLFLVAGVIALLTMALNQFVRHGTIALLLLVVQFLALGLVVLTGKRLLFSAIEGALAFQHLDRIAKLFDALWWLLPALYLVLLLNRFAWPYLERRTERTVPKMIKALTATAIVLLAGFGVIAFVYQQPVTSLLATSGLVGLIVGLAVQANIANVFAGIVLSAERPFALGDVIELAGHGVARVTDMTWRTTRMVTPTSLEVSVPNSAVAEGFIRNHSRSGAVKTVVDVWLPPSLPIDWATGKILEGIGRSERILREPPFGVEYGGVQVRGNQWAMNYQAYFFVDDGIQSGAICSDVSHHIWATLAEAGVTSQLGAGEPSAPKDDRMLQTAAGRF